MRKYFILLFLLTALSFIRPSVALADTVSCTCYCGVVIYPPCTDEECKQRCGYHESSGTGSGGSSISPAVYSGFYNLGYSIGQSIGQALMGNPQQRRNEALSYNNQGLAYFNNQQWQDAVVAFSAALQDSPNDATIQQNLALAQQMLQQQIAAEEAARRAAEEKRKQEMLEHINSQLKQSGEGPSQEVGLDSLKSDDNGSGEEGVKGLPGIYLNDNTGKGSNKPYGIPGLPGIYVNGPRDGGGLVEQGGLMLKKDDEPAQNNHSSNVSNNPNEANAQPSGGANASGFSGSETGSGAGQGTGSGAAPAAGTGTGPSSGSELVQQGGLMLKNDNEAPQAPPQVVNNQAPERLQQQAQASQAAVGAQTPEEASAQARAGFDTALPGRNSAPISLGQGSRSSATSVPQSQAKTASAPASLQANAGSSQTVDIVPHAQQTSAVGASVSTVPVLSSLTAGQTQQAGKLLETNKPLIPNLNVADLSAGAVILVGSDNSFKSNTIRSLDRLASHNPDATASHAAVFLGERNGKRWYMDHTSEHGTVILDEEEFLRHYGQRPIDVGVLTKPLSQHEIDEMWKGVHDLGKERDATETNYWFWYGDRIVCSQAVRRVLRRAGRDIPETQSGNVKVLGVNTHVGKKDFVDFSPEDFYENAQWFEIKHLEVPDDLRKGIE